MEKQLIFSKKVATELIKKGNELLTVTPNLKIKGYVVYIFNKTEKLIQDLTCISNK